MPSDQNTEARAQTQLSPLNTAPTELRLSTATAVAMDEQHVLIANRATGQYKLWSRDYEVYLNRYTRWQRLPDVVHELVDGKDDLTDYEREVALLHDLLRLGVMEERTKDMNGRHLPDPGPAWGHVQTFLSATRTTRDTIYAVPEEYNEALSRKADRLRQPSAFYERGGTVLHALPKPQTRKRGRAVRFEDVMTGRRTARRFAEEPVSELDLSLLLYYAWGMTDKLENPLGDSFIRKTSPSGGSLHPVEVYPIVMNVEGVESGLYHYSVRQHALERISLENPREWVATASGDQHWVAEAAVVFLCTAFLPRSAWKYHYSRVGRAVISEVGFTGQSFLLTATWLKLGCFTTIALRDQIWEEKLQLDPNREPVFAIYGAGKLEDDVDRPARPRYESAPGVARS